MNKNHAHADDPKKHRAMKRLDNKPADVESLALPIPAADNEMLSLIVSDVLGGVDIAARYPTFYQKLLKDGNLRQAFVDALESLEKGDEPIFLPKTIEADLAFLAKLPPQSLLEELAGTGWKISLQRTIKQLQSIFSPPELAYRWDSSLSEDPWFTLLRDEVDVKGILYTVVLECTLSEEDDKALSAFLNFAVTIRTGSDRPHFPIQVTLRWGTYYETIHITEDGRTRFPNIPLDLIFDKERQNLKSDINLSLQAAT